MPSNNNSIAAEVVAASVGGAFSATALYPLEVLKTKMQAETKKKKKKEKDEEQDEKKKKKEKKEEQEGEVKNNLNEDDDDDEDDKKDDSMVTYASRMYETGGLGVFYGGVGTSAFQSAMEKALYFFAYTLLKNVYGWMSGASELKTLPNLLVGCAAEWAHLPITLPLDCWTTKIQTSTSGKSPMALLWELMQHPGNMYKGVQAYVVLCLKPAIQYTVFEQVKALVLAGRQQRRQQQRQSPSNRRAASSLSAMEAFLLGMVSRTIATLVVFPYLRAKVMLQSTSNSETKKASIPEMLYRIYASEGGMSELYRGIGPELTRGVLSAALMMMVKEKIAALALAATTTTNSTTTTAASHPATSSSSSSSSLQHRRT